MHGWHSLIDVILKALTKVAQMHDGMKPGLEEDDVADQLVQVDVIVQGEDGGQPQLAALGNGVAQDQHQDQHRVEQQTSP